MTGDLAHPYLKSLPVVQRTVQVQPIPITIFHHGLVAFYELALLVADGVPDS